MAYSYAVTWSHRAFPAEKGGSRRGHLVIKCVETDAAIGSEWNTEGTGGGTVTGPGGLSARVPVFPVGTITFRRHTKTAGDAATIDPIYGMATGAVADTVNFIAQNGTAAAHITDAVQVPYTFDPNTSANGGTLYVRSISASGTNNVITTLIVLVEGHV